MPTLSIARALVELKTLDSRIGKITNNTNWILLKSKNKNSNINEEEFKKSTISEFQSLNDLIMRRDKIKNAIILSNCSATVLLGEKKMTVSQAIEYKKTIQYKKYLDDTDHKLFVDYEAKPGEDLDAIKSLRKKARDFIRENTIVLPDGPESNS